MVTLNCVTCSKEIYCHLKRVYNSSSQIGKKNVNEVFYNTNCKGFLTEITYSIHVLPPTFKLCQREQYQNSHYNKTLLHCLNIKRILTTPDDSFTQVILILVANLTVGGLSGYWGPHSIFSE